MPAGHSANASYWYDVSTGNWISSTYYMNQLPSWVTELNNKKLVDQYYTQGWKTLYPIDTYTQSDSRNPGGNTEAFGKGNKFPYQLDFLIGKNYSVIEATPHGNTFTLEMARQAITNESLGKDSVTDFLTLSLSSPDYIGHTFGPNSIEAEDDYLRLDKDLGAFIDFLDKQIGRKDYLVFITADHGVAHVPSFLKAHKIPAGSYDTDKLTADLNAAMQDRFRVSGAVVGVSNNQVFLNRQDLGKGKTSMADIYKFIADYLTTLPFVARAFPLPDVNEVPLNSVIKEKVINGYYPQRCGDIQIIPKPQFIEGFEKSGTTHGNWNPYDAHIPLIWFGWNIKHGQTFSAASMSDIAPTISSLLHIQSPSGCVGKPIKEVVE